MNDVWFKDIKHGSLIFIDESMMDWTCIKPIISDGSLLITNKWSIIDDFRLLVRSITNLKWVYTYVR